MRKFLTEGDFETVGSGTFSTMTLEPTGHYYGLALNLYKDNAGAFDPMSEQNILDDISRIEVQITKKSVGVIEIVKIEPERLIEWLDWRYGEQSAYALAGCLPIPFTRNGFSNAVDDINVMGIGTDDVTRISVAVFYKTNAGFLCNKVTMKKDWDADLNIKLGTYPVLFQEEREVNTTGVKKIDDLPQQIATAGHLSLHFTEGAAGVADEIDEVRYGGQAIMQNVDATDHARLAHEGHRRPQSGLWSIDFQQHKNLLSVNNQKFFEVKVNWSTAPGQYDVIHDMVYGMT